MAIGVAQIVDAFANEKSTLPDGGSLPGFIASGIESKYAPLIDAISGFGPGALTGKGIDKLSGGFLEAWNNWKEEKSLYNSLGLLDAILDGRGFVTEGFENIPKIELDKASQVKFGISGCKTIDNKNGTKTDVVDYVIDYKLKLDDGGFVKKQKRYRVSSTYKATSPSAPTE